MARPKTSLLNVARKKLPDGTIREYFYDRKTKQFLGHERAAAEARITADLDRAASTALAPGTFAALIVQYLGSAAYRRLAPSTQKLYRGYLDAMRREYGDLLVTGIKRHHIKAIKEANAGQPRKANQIIALFRILLRIAEEDELIDRNPAERPGRLPTAARSEIWSVTEEDAFFAAAGLRLGLAFALLLYTIQRPADVLAMTTGRVTEHDGRMFIRLRQAKTDELLDIPVHGRLAPFLTARLTAQPLPNRPHLAATPSILLVPSPTGKAWAYRNFARAWDAACVTAGVEGRQRRDLRRTGIVRLAEAGATTPQIAAVSGHSIDYCQRIIDTYLPRRTEVAIGAIEAWERTPTPRGNVVRLPPKRQR